MREVKDTNELENLPNRNIWKLHEASIRNDCNSYNKEFKKNSETVGSVEIYKEVLEGVLLKATSGLWMHKRLVHREKAPPGIDKHGGGMMMSVKS